MKHNCSGLVECEEGFRQCQSGAKIQRGDDWYCWMHDPYGEEKRNKVAQKSSEIQIKSWHGKK